MIRVNGSNKIQADTQGLALTSGDLEGQVRECCSWMGKRQNWGRRAQVWDSGGIHLGLGGLCELGRGQEE